MSKRAREADNAEDVVANVAARATALNARAGKALADASKFVQLAVEDPERVIDATDESWIRRALKSRITSKSFATEDLKDGIRSQFASLRRDYDAAAKLRSQFAEDIAGLQRELMESDGAEALTPAFRAFLAERKLKNLTSSVDRFEQSLYDIYSRAQQDIAPRALLVRQLRAVARRPVLYARGVRSGRIERHPAPAALVGGAGAGASATQT